MSTTPALTSWCPSSRFDSLLALGSKSFTFDSKTYETRSNLSIVSTNPTTTPSSPSPSSNPFTTLGEVSVKDKFTSLAWGAKGISTSTSSLSTSSSSLHHGIIAGGMSDGSINFWSPTSIINNHSIRNNNYNSHTDTLVEPLLARQAGIHSSDVTALAFHPKLLNIFASGSNDGEVFMWDIATMQNIKAVRPNTTKPGQSSSNNDPNPTRIVASPSLTEVQWSEFIPKLLTTGNAIGETVIYDLHQKRQILTFKPTTPVRVNTAVSAIRWGSEVELAIAYNSYHCVEIWDFRYQQRPILKLDIPSYTPLDHQDNLKQMLSQGQLQHGVSAMDWDTSTCQLTIADNYGFIHYYDMTNPLYSPDPIGQLGLGGDFRGLPGPTLRPIVMLQQQPPLHYPYQPKLTETICPPTTQGFIKSISPHPTHEGLFASCDDSSVVLHQRPITPRQFLSTPDSKLIVKQSYISPSVPPTPTTVQSGQQPPTPQQQQQAILQQLKLRIITPTPGVTIGFGGTRLSWGREARTTYQEDDQKSAALLSQVNRLLWIDPNHTIPTMNNIGIATDQDNNETSSQSSSQINPHTGLPPDILLPPDTDQYLNLIQQRLYNLSKELTLPGPTNEPASIQPDGFVADMLRLSYHDDGLSYYHYIEYKILERLAFGLNSPHGVDPDLMYIKFCQLFGCGTLPPQQFEQQPQSQVQIIDHMADRKPFNSPLQVGPDHDPSLPPLSSLQQQQHHQTQFQFDYTSSNSLLDPDLSNFAGFNEENPQQPHEQQSENYTYNSPLLPPETPIECSTVSSPSNSISQDLQQHQQQQQNEQEQEHSHSLITEPSQPPIFDLLALICMGNLSHAIQQCLNTQVQNPQQQSLDAIFISLLVDNSAVTSGSALSTTLSTILSTLASQPSPHDDQQHIGSIYFVIDALLNRNYPVIIERANFHNWQSIFSIICTYTRDDKAKYVTMLYHHLRTQAIQSTQQPLKKAETLVLSFLAMLSGSINDVLGYWKSPLLAPQTPLQFQLYNEKSTLLHFIAAYHPVLPANDHTAIPTILFNDFAHTAFSLVTRCGLAGTCNYVEAVSRLLTTLRKATKLSDLFVKFPQLTQVMMEFNTFSYRVFVAAGFHTQSENVPFITQAPQPTLGVREHWQNIMNQRHHDKNARLQALIALHPEHTSLPPAVMMPSAPPLSSTASSHPYPIQNQSHTAPSSSSVSPPQQIVPQTLQTINPQQQHPQQQQQHQHQSLLTSQPPQQPQQPPQQQRQPPVSSAQQQPPQQHPEEYQPNETDLSLCALLHSFAVNLEQGCQSAGFTNELKQFQRIHKTIGELIAAIKSNQINPGLKNELINLATLISHTDYNTALIINTGIGSGPYNINSAVQSWVAAMKFLLQTAKRLVN